MPVVMKGCPGAGTAAGWLTEKQEELKAYFPTRFLREAGQLLGPLAAETSVPEGAVSLKQGLYAALWQLGEQEKCGLVIETEAVRPPQAIIELAEYFAEDPLQLPGSGYVALRPEFPEEGEQVIGWQQRAAARVLKGAGGERFLTKPQRRTEA